MNVVLGIGEQLQTDGSDELTAHGATLSETARRLTRTTEKGLEIDRIFARPVATDRIDLQTTITDIVSRLVEDYPNASIDTSIGVVAVRTDSRILHEVVKETVVNALEHSGDVPVIRIEATATQSEIELTVTDDGPGIPQSEIQPVMTGEETALDHASRLGLWFIKWGMERIGGNVDFVSTDSGTEVTLQVRDNPASTGETQPQEADNEFVT
jgi:signal transduction histidine kinase